MSSKIGTVLDNIEQGNAAESVAKTIALLNDGSAVEGHNFREFGDASRVADELQEQNQRNVQDIIKGLLELREEKGAPLGDDLSSHVCENKEKERALSNVCQEVEKIQDEVQDEQKEKYSHEELQARLIEQRERVKEETTHVLPKTRYNISLYKCLTGINWDYECPPEQIKGYVSTTTDARPFSLSTQQNSKFFITNYLWDLVGMACESK